MIDRSEYFAPYHARHSSSVRLRLNFHQHLLVSASPMIVLIAAIFR